MNTSLTREIAMKVVLRDYLQEVREELLGNNYQLVFSDNNIFCLLEEFTFSPPVMKLGIVKDVTTDDVTPYLMTIISGHLFFSELTTREYESYEAMPAHQAFFEAWKRCDDAMRYQAASINSLHT